MAMCMRNVAKLRNAADAAIDPLLAKLGIDAAEGEVLSLDGG